MSMPQAQAGVPMSYTANGVYIRSYASTGATAYGMGYTIHRATAVCGAYGTSVGGNPWWIKHTDNSTGVRGYSSWHYTSFAGYSLPAYSSSTCPTAY